MQILQNPGWWATSWEASVHHMRVMFARASRMAQYVVEHYPKKEKRKSQTKAKKRPKNKATCIALGLSSGRVNRETVLPSFDINEQAARLASDQ